MRISSWPYSSTAFCAIASLSAAERVSVRTKTALPPSLLISAAVRSPPSQSISAITIFAPSRAKRRQAPLPIPLEPPVMRATRPSRRPLINSLPASEGLVELVNSFDIFAHHQPGAALVQTLEKPFEFGRP